MKRCERCALPETYPGIKFDSSGICNYCNYLDASENMRKSLNKDIKEQFSGFIEDSKKHSKDYDCVVCYSGGKDSTFLLMRLKEEFDLRVIAYTLDNGFISEKAFDNIRKITEALDVDHMMFKPRQNIVNRIFRDTLTGRIHYPKELTSMLSPLCAACQGIVLGFAVRFAIDKKIPLIFVGFTPGQYPDVSYENFLKSKSCIYLTDTVNRDDPPDIIKIIRDPIDEISGEEAGSYYFKSQYLEKDTYCPHILFPFQTIFDYDEKEIYKKIKSLGWEKPKDTDACSTNCLINNLSNYAFVKQYGYHPYIAEISSMVREGLLSYKDVRRLEKIKKNTKAMKTCMKKLKISEKDLDAK